MREVELKFEIAPDALREFRRSLSATPSRRTRQLALYFDTADFEIAERGMALRLRRQGRRWVQCLKRGESGSGGLHARDEWEHVQKGPILDLAAFGPTPLSEIEAPGTLHERLKPVFRVDGTRTRWEIAVAGARVEVDLDEAVVEGADRREAICEVEVESLDGNPLAVFDVASGLLESTALRPLATTKAERGYRLVRGVAPAPVKARSLKLEPSMSVEAAARVTLAAALGQIQANDAGAIAGRDPEYVHQMRVGMRRLRSAVRTFGDVMPAELREGTREDLRWIGQATGTARDWDVLATTTLPPLAAACADKAAIRALRARVAHRRRLSHAAMREALSSARYARLLLAFARWLATEPSPALPGGPSLREYAATLLRKRQKRLVEHAANLAGLTPAERHRLRIEAKRLRYALDGFAPLFKGKRMRAFRQTLAQLQDDLGRANDAATAQRLIAEIEAPESLRQFAHGWLSAQAHASLYRLQRHFEALAAPPRTWKRWLPRSNPAV